MPFCIFLCFFVCLFLQAPITTRLLLRRILTVLSLKDWMAYYSLLKNNHFSGDNFFKSASYTIEVVSAEPFSAQKEKLRSVEAKIIAKRSELSKFESEYREVCGSL
jgi:hypothetical protein